MGEYIRNHYVPEWYQYRFFEGTEKEKKFFYLDLTPETITTRNGNKFTRNSILRWGPPRCFYEDHLYTTRFLGWESTEIEEKFFGKIDTNGKQALEYFSEFTHPSVDYDAYRNFLPFMSVQKIRTPKGLRYLSQFTKSTSKNQLLIDLQEFHMMHCALWTECVWSVADASSSNTKFIVTDNPVTVYNQSCFPASSWCRGSNEPGIWLNGTHTIFPLSIDKVLILTNLSWARNPYGNPLKERPHSQLFRPTIFKFNDIQTERELTEKEVITINYILKSRAHRYIAAAKKEWLFPEKSMKRVRWDKIGKSYQLMPDPRSMSFSSEIIIGYDDRRGDAFDEYGRKPWHEDYKDKDRFEYEWESFHAFQGEFARLVGPKRRGRSFQHTHLDNEVDSEDYHAYHLQNEQRCKENMKKLKRRK